jgi:hypothetical protein
MKMGDRKNDSSGGPIAESDAVVVGISNDVAVTESNIEGVGAAKAVSMLLLLF